MRIVSVALIAAATTAIGGVAGSSLSAGVLDDATIDAVLEGHPPSGAHAGHHEDVVEEDHTEIVDEVDHGPAGAHPGSSEEGVAGKGDGDGGEGGEGEEEETRDVEDRALGRDGTVDVDAVISMVDKLVDEIVSPEDEDDEKLMEASALLLCRKVQSLFDKYSGAGGCLGSRVECEEGFMAALGELAKAAGGLFKDSAAHCPFQWSGKEEAVAPAIIDPDSTDALKSDCERRAEEGAKCPKSQKPSSKAIAGTLVADQDAKEAQRRLRRQEDALRKRDRKISEVTTHTVTKTETHRHHSRGRGRKPSGPRKLPPHVPDHKCSKCQKCKKTGHCVKHTHNVNGKLVLISEGQGENAPQDADAQEDAPQDAPQDAAEGATKKPEGRDACLKRCAQGDTTASLTCQLDCLSKEEHSEVLHDEEVARNAAKIAEKEAMKVKIAAAKSLRAAGNTEDLSNLSYHDLVEKGLAALGDVETPDAAVRVEKSVHVPDSESASAATTRSTGSTDKASAEGSVSAKNSADADAIVNAIRGGKTA